MSSAVDKYGGYLEILQNGNMPASSAQKLLDMYEPLKFVVSMDRERYKKWSTISTSSISVAMVIRIWMEDNKHKYGIGVACVFCEPEIAVVFALMAFPWDYTIIRQPNEEEG